MLTGEEKGALLLKNLAPEVVEKVLARLEPGRRNRLRALMSRITAGLQTQQNLAELLEELRSELARKKDRDEHPATLPMPNRTSPAATETAPAAPPTPAPASAPAYPPAPAAQGAVRPTTPAGLAIAPGDDPLKAFATLTAERIVLVLEGETARTASIILNYLDEEKAAAVFRGLPPALRGDISVQFSTQNMPSLDVLRRMAHALILKTQRIEEKPAFPEGAARQKKMADMLRQLDKPQRLEVLTALEAKAPQVAEQIKGMLYRFDDVLRIEARSLQKILKDVDTKTLANALRDAPDGIKQKFLAGLSKRAQENLGEEIELSQSAPKEEIQEAQRAIVGVIQRLDLAGELVMTD